jgi:IS5 family transposase
VLRLPEELTRVDALLDDPAFFAPFAPHFHPVLGRPSTPAEWYLRLMFLKFRYRLGYESLCGEVSDSISWRRFCRIGLDGRVPHATTLMKLTTRCGEVAVAGLNEALLARAAGQKLLRTGRLGADTTVIAADVAYPTDSGLLARAAGKMARTVRRAGGRGRHPDPGAGPAAGCRAAGAGDRGQAADPGQAGPETARVIARVTGELADLAETAAAELRRCCATAAGPCRRRSAGGCGAGCGGRWMSWPSPSGGPPPSWPRPAAGWPGRCRTARPRLVSLHDPDARPIRKGRIDRPAGIRVQGPGRR